MENENYEPLFFDETVIIVSEMIKLWRNDGYTSTGSQFF
jgi:hypothetical protein